MKVTKFVSTAALLLLSAFIITSCDSKPKQDASKPGAGAGQRPPARVEGYVVQTRLLSETVEVPGTLVASESTEIHPEVTGRIISLNIREGAQVRKGDVIAKLYDADLQAQKRKLEVQLQIAKQTESRYEQLQKIGGISKQDYDVTRLDVSNIRADLDIVNTSIAKTVIRAPFSGKLGLKQVSTGAFVSPTTVVTTIQKTEGLRIDFNIPEKYTSDIRKGQYVNFTVDASGRKYTAQIMATESGITQDTRSLGIRAVVVGNATGLVPGAFAKVNMSFDPNPDAIMIPTQAVIPQARGKKVYVYRNGKADFVEVTTGFRDSVMVQITSGLSKGDTVITTGLLSLKPDAKVIVNTGKTKAAGTTADSASSRGTL